MVCMDVDSFAFGEGEDIGVVTDASGSVVVSFVSSVFVVVCAPLGVNRCECVRNRERSIGIGITKERNGTGRNEDADE